MFTLVHWIQGDGNGRGVDTIPPKDFLKSSKEDLI